MAWQAFDIGLGTTYERFALNAWLIQLAASYPVQSVLEGPGDGMTGIPGLNSLVFGRLGKDVVVVLDDSSAIKLASQGWRSQRCLDRAQFLTATDGRLPVSRERFDLVWNFNRLPFFEPRGLIAEMVRVSRRYVLLFVPNRTNYGFLARKLHHRLTGSKWPYGDTGVMSVAKVTGLLEAFDLDVLETVLLDAPWWPDIIDISTFVTDLLPPLATVLPEKRASAYCWDPEHLPYFDDETYAHVHRHIQSLFFIERRKADWIKRPFAHHFGVLAAKRGISGA